MDELVSAILTNTTKPDIYEHAQKGPGEQIKSVPKLYPQPGEILIMICMENSIHIVKAGLKVSAGKS